MVLFASFFASRLAMAGVSLLTISELMGHKTIQMTNQSAHLAPAHNQATVERLVEFHAEPGFAGPGDPAIIFVFLLFVSVTVVLCLFWVRNYDRVMLDIERRVVEVIEGAPEHVWVTRGGFCYLGIAGRTIRVPNDVYGELRESNMVKVAFLPTALVAVQVETARGLGLSPSLN